MRVQIRLLEQLLRDHQHSRRVGHQHLSMTPSSSAIASPLASGAGGMSPTSAGGPSHSTNLLTAAFLTMRSSLGQEQANRVLLSALRGEVLDEVDAVERLVASLCEEVNYRGTSY